MPNLNGSNWVRQTPKFTHSQVEALKLLNIMLPADRVETLTDHGEWKAEYKSLNRKDLSDILYTLATGEYELDIDEHEKYLMNIVDHWHSRDILLYNEMKKVLEEYRLFQKQAEE
ncbi:hypothetical protein 035JT004_61 [Bacillus phage 035JT004]|nr:hypothetical protein 035JT004_61 [Bacillus phage 035JT004]